MSDPFQKIIEYFSDFPGIGPRQAKRFAYYLLTRNSAHLEDLALLITDLKKQIKTCDSCFRFFLKDTANSVSCPLCRDSNRDKSQLIVVSRDVDLETIERGHSFGGLYFVLGGSVPILEKNPEQRIRIKELTRIVEERSKQNGLKEIILALNLNAEGENTEEYLKKVLSPLGSKYNFKISVLGRGLSTGSELEYSDSETIKHALKNRV